jgi:hypothetical protein
MVIKKVMARRKRSKKQFIQLFTQYGIHIWAILIIANAVMVYAYQFSTHAEGKSPSFVHSLVVSTSPSISPSSSTISSIPSISSSPSPSTAPLGPVINLIFTVPGIGSGGGVMTPLHPKRNVTIYLYAPNVNSLNPTVKPLFTIQTHALFNSNIYSPTYTSYLNPSVDLGSDITNGNYQIAFKTDLSLRMLIKQNPTDLGGEIFSLTKGSPSTIIPSQSILMGAVLPTQDDSVININDYNAFISCYGSLNNTNSFCKTGNYGDFNDDGLINGLDYNILIRAIYALSQEGIPVPELSPTPTLTTNLISLVTPHAAAKSNTPTPKVIPKIQKNSRGGAIVGLFLFIFFLLIVGGILLFLFFKNENFHNLINSILHLSPSGQPSSDTAETEEATAENPEAVETTEESVETDAQTDNTKEEPLPEEAPSQAPPVAPTADGIVEKDCYIKTKGADESGTGMWLLLTDDNGALNAHYNKNDAKDGFAKVKGVMKEENGKKFLEVSELTMEG